MKRDFTILVVLFNKRIEDSHTIQSLIKVSNLLKNEQIFIWDNSEQSMDEESLIYLEKIFGKVQYKHTAENTVLSKVYNHVIDAVLKESDYTILFDDDSNIPEYFFLELYDQIKKNPNIQLFLPQIYSNSILVSPAKDFFIKTKLIKDIEAGLMQSKYTTAINSGMVISNTFFQDGFRYNEQLNFYGTDNFFMYQYSKKNEDLIVLNVKINHDLSFNSSEDINRKIRIFKEIKRANKIIYSESKLKLSVVLFNNFIVSVKNCFKYRTLAFLYD